MSRLNEMVKERGVTLRLMPTARKWLIEKTCADRMYGARPLKRALQKYVEDGLSEALIKGDVGRLSDLEIYLHDDELMFREAMPDVLGAEQPQIQ